MVITRHLLVALAVAVMCIASANAAPQSYRGPYLWRGAPDMALLRERLTATDMVSQMVLSDSLYWAAIESQVLPEQRIGVRKTSYVRAWTKDGPINSIAVVVATNWRGEKYFDNRSGSFIVSHRTVQIMKRGDRENSAWIYLRFPVRVSEVDSLSFVGFEEEEN